MKMEKAKAATNPRLQFIEMVSALMLVLTAVIVMWPITGHAQETLTETPEHWDWGSVSTKGWAECDQKCAIETINAAQTVVMFHTKEELRQDEAEALVGAVRRGARVEIYVGKANNLSDEVIWFADDIYQKWAETAEDTDTSMLGMGGCVMGQTNTPAFIVTDPFGRSARDAPALVVGGKKTDTFDVAAAASVAIDAEDFIQCKLNKQN